jgi:TolA-binding protein
MKPEIPACRPGEKKEGDMKKIFVLTLSIILAAGFVYAEEQESFWYKMLKKLNSISTRGPGGRTYTSVVGARGAEDTSSDELYWKGEAQKKGVVESNISEKELSDFKLAVDQASQGEKRLAMTSFQTFLKTYPDSELTPDARAAIDQLEKEASASE